MVKPDDLSADPGPQPRPALLKLRVGMGVRAWWFLGGVGSWERRAPGHWGRVVGWLAAQNVVLVQAW